jgi:hypothetical protein
LSISKRAVAEAATAEEPLVDVRAREMTKVIRKKFGVELHPRTIGGGNT